MARLDARLRRLRAKVQGNHEDLLDAYAERLTDQELNEQIQLLEWLRAQQGNGEDEAGLVVGADEPEPEWLQALSKEERVRRIERLVRLAGMRPDS